jgi:hypothetical protein
MVGIVDVIADPDLEQVAEDVQRLGLAGAPAKKRRNKAVAPGDRGDRCRSEMKRIKRSRPSR